MKTRTITIYSFDELTERAKDKAIEKLFHTNVYFEWWEYIFEDAKKAGIEITGFDIDRGNQIKGNPIVPLTDSLKAILANHGEVCETYKTAISYKQTLDDLLAKDALLPEDEQDSYDFEQSMDELREAFCKEILEDYLTMLRHEFEYQTSRETIEETIKANNYDFDENGNLI